MTRISLISLDCFSTCFPSLMKFRIKLILSNILGAISHNSPQQCVTLHSLHSLKNASTHFTHWTISWPSFLPVLCSFCNNWEDVAIVSHFSSILHCQNLHLVLETVQWFFIFLGMTECWSKTLTRSHLRTK